MALRNQTTQYRRVVQYELNKITLNNFRSISQQTIEIKPLTIVVGGNSAGKSSLLKAVLLMAQAQREKNIPGEVALNGSWVRLEQFKSVVHGGDLEERIKIGLNFSVSQERRRVTPDLVIPSRSANVSEWAFMLINDLNDELSYEIEIGSTERNRGVALITSCVLEIPGGRVGISRSGGDDQNSVDSLGALPFSGNFDFSRQDDIDSAVISGAILSGAIVTQVAIDRPLIDELYEKIVRRLQSFFTFRSQSSREHEISDLLIDPNSYLDELFDMEISKSNSLHEWSEKGAARLILRELISRGLSAEGALATLEFVQDSGVEQVAAEMARRTYPMASYVFTNILSNEVKFPVISGLLREEIQKAKSNFGSAPRLRKDKKTEEAIFLLMVSACKALKDSMGDLERHFVEIDPKWGTKVSVISEKHEVVGAAELDAFLGRSVHFLGPLRIAPTSAADYSRRGSDRGVGPEGQHLAYQLMMNPIVSGFQWKDFSKDRGDLEVKNQEMSFASAMSYWVKGLRLADSVRAEEIPGVGDSIKLVVPGVKSELSPNDVGVGVSQVLPVIGAILLANPGDLVVLEQPELHLHPDAQLELAEFFVAAMKSGRRLLIESHSEHFLNKLRLMAAKADDDVAKELTEMVGFVFAERGLEDGLSHFREVKLTTDGSIQDWPKGFFDQGANAAKDLFLLRQKRQKS
jgi:predicted ATPase